MHAQLRFFCCFAEDLVLIVCQLAGLRDAREVGRILGPHRTVTPSASVFVLLYQESK